MAAWADQEVLKLVELWGEDSVQEQLEGCKRNSQVYDRIAREMQIAGFDRTGQQCRDKMKKLRSEYRKIKDSNSRTGESRSKWKFFECMDAILGCKPSTRPPVVLDTLSAIVLPDHVPVEDNTTECITGGGESFNSSCSEPTPSPSPYPTVPIEAGTSKRSCTPTSTEGPSTKKAKISKSEKIEKMISKMHDQLLASLETTDAKLVELEKQRLEMEERAIEKEDIPP